MVATSERAHVECVLEQVAITGESPVWSASEQALYFIDIQQPALHRFDPVTEQHRHWPLPDEIGCFALYAEGAHALVALRSGLYELTLADGALRLLAASPFNPQLFRFNEGACDATGRFWAGTMFDPKLPKEQIGATAERGAWYSFSAAGGLEPHPDFAVIPNGLAWDASYRTLYLSHSTDRTIYAFDFDLEAGRLGARRIFATIPQDVGIPDGCAVDETGGYWCALHGGGRLRRFHAGGQFDRDVLLPVSQPTMCAFGGRDLDTLYVTSKSRGLSAEERRREPLAGKLIRFQPGMRGRPAAPFGARTDPGRRGA